ncbi:MAG: LTA synthase family protein, partial [Oscillospiraceae bacterium]|nr:LTA synthase family protein [Oscillospiraceae bacterium]
RRIIYYSILSLVFAILCGANSIYYSNYRSFISFSLLATASQLGGVANAVTGYIMEIKDLVFIWAPIAVLGTHFYIKKKHPAHYANTERVQKGRKLPLKVFVCSLCILGVFALTLTGTDWSRLRKQWNREYVLGKFGMCIYQLSDIVSSIAAKFNTIWGYEESQQTFTDFYGEPHKDGKNAYTDIFKDKNIIAIHAESIQNFTLGTFINGEELTPNLNKLVDEGIYFSNFYAQESVGTSSDSEFTFSTSLLPATSSTVAINYWDRNYTTIPKLLGEKGYYAFSMHGNNGSYWNRLNFHNSFGYQRLYHYSNDFNLDENIGLGLSDKSFFRQAISKIQQIDKEHQNYYGVMIMLTNHTPFTDIENYSDFEVDFKYKKYNDETGAYEETSADFLEGTSMGSYLKSVHYADEAIGQFIGDLDSAGLLEDTVIVIYGDHDAKIKEEEYEYYYNYNPFEDEMLDEDDDAYIAINDFIYNINREVPFIIWSKDMPCEPVEVTTVMGMYDCLPTLGNMFGFESEYALGTDIFSLGKNEENVVVFP